MPTVSHSPDSIPGKEMHVALRNKDKDATLLKRSGSSPNLRRLVSKVLRSSSMKNLLFKSKKHKSPVEIVRETRALLLLYFNSGADAGHPKRDEKLEELDAHIRELKSILYGSDVSEPVAEACSQLTQEFFREDTPRLLILSLPYLNLEVVARYILKSEHMKKFFDYIQFPNFDVASNAADTFKELMMRHKFTVAEFLTENYNWFFAEFNSKLLESTNYITKRNAVKLLGDILLDRTNSGVMIRYVSSKYNMRVLMNLLRESHKSIRIDAFHVFKLFVANQRKPPEIFNILFANKTKLLHFFEDFNVDKVDETFEADKAQVIQEIKELQPRTPLTCSGELFKPLAS